MQKKISMNKQEIAQGLSPFVMMAFVDAQNLETGFLTRHRINKLTKEQIMGFSMETEKIINKLSHQLEQVADGNIPTDYECETIFQHVFITFIITFILILRIIILINLMMYNKFLTIHLDHILELMDEFLIIHHLLKVLLLLNYCFYISIL